MKKMFSRLAGLLLLATASSAASAETVPLSAFGSETDGLKVSVMAKDLQTGTIYTLEGSDTATRHSPWSTFKIPNLMIALETGAVPTLDDVTQWDASKRPAEEWWPDAWKREQTLDTAFRRSAVWYFRDVALKVKTPAYRDYLSRWNYGNAEVPEGSDDFWLRQPLAISVQEQVAFLESFANQQLGLSEKTRDGFLTASQEEETYGDMVLHGKTGAGRDADGTWSGWYVGLVRDADGEPSTVFALHTQASSFDALKDFRKAFAVRFLKETGALPQE